MGPCCNMGYFKFNQLTEKDMKSEFISFTERYFQSTKTLSDKLLKLAAAEGLKINGENITSFVSLWIKDKNKHSEPVEIA